MAGQPTLINKPWEKITRDIRHIIKFRHLFYLMLPAIIYFILFRYRPLYGVIIAFKDYKVKLGILDSPWVGLANFKRVFSGTTFFEVFRNTVILSFYKLVFGFPAPIILALMLNEIRNVKYKKIIQTLTYMPHFLSWVVIAGMFVMLLSPSTGIVSHIFRFFGLEPIYFLGNPNWFRPTLVFTHVWQTAGYNCIIFLAAITGINPSLYESAMMDGASRMQRIRHITLPCIKNVVVILLILRSGELIYDDFEQVYNFLNDAVLSKGDVISTYVYRVGLEKMKYSYAATVDFFRNVIALALVMSTNFVAKKFGEEGIW